MELNFTKTFILRNYKLALICVVWLACLMNYALAQTSETYKWSNVAIGGGGFVSGLITSKEQPGLIYARTDVGGAYRWDSANGKWIPLMDWASDEQQGMYGTESLAIDPQNPNIVYISAGISYFNNGKSYILRSTDYGENFTITDVTAQFKMHGNGMGRQNGERLQVDPNNSSIIYCGTRWNGLFKSTNSGAAWSRVTALNVTTTANENGISFVVLDKSSATTGNATQRIFVGVSRAGSNQNLYMSTNGGTDFSALINPNLAADLLPQRAVLSGDGNLYITYGDGAGPHGHWAVTTEDYTTGQIWKYNIGSGAWTNITPAGMNKPFSGISVDPANPQRLVASTTNTYLFQQGSAYGDRFFISTNGGASWTDVIASRGMTLDPNGVSWVSTQSIHWSGSIEFDPSNTNRVFVTSGNGVFVNEDINASKIWKFAAHGIEETVPINVVSIPGGPLVSVILDYDGFRHTDVTQYAPIHSPRIGSTTGLDYGATNRNKIVRVGSALYYSNDMGLTWTQAAVTNGTKGQVAVSSDGNTILHCPDGATTTYRSINNGSSWTTASGLNFNARPVADGVNPNKFYAYDNSSASLKISTDGGASFVATGSPGSGGSKIIRTVPGKEGHIWVALYSSGLSRSTTSGATFTKISNVTNCGAVGIGMAAPGSSYETIYIYGTVAGVLGVHRSTDQGASWIRVNDDAHEYGGPANGQFVVGDMNIYGRVYMSTAGRGIAYGESTAPASNYLNVSPAALAYTSAAGSQTVNVSSDLSWTVSANQSWITPSVTNGTNDGTFTINVTSNTSASSRAGTVTVTASGITKGITITQDAACTPTAIVPYVIVGNGKKWVQTSTASVSVGGRVRLGPQAGSGGSWSWTGPNGFTAATREVTISNIQANQAGNYIVTYTNTSNCTSSQTFTITVTGATTASIVDASLSIAPVAVEHTGLLIYPNPVENKVNISVPEELIGSKLTLSNINGAVVYGGSISQSTQSIDMSQMPAGIYVLSIKGSGKGLSAKILKK